MASAVIRNEELPLASWSAMGLIIASGVLAIRVPAAAAAARQALEVND